MTMVITHLFTSFIAAASFGVIFNAPRKSLLRCGFVGMVGWIIYIILVNNHYDAIPASLISAVFISAISHIFAKIYRTPIIIFSVAGIIPLVPGGISYDAMRHFVLNDYNMAIQLAAKAFMISGAIAVGLVIAEVFFQLFMKAKHKITSRNT